VTIDSSEITAINVTVNEVLELTCKDESYPTALVHWEENSLPVTDSNQMAELSVIVNSTVLGATIEYTCVAENSVGGMNHTARNSVLFHVQGKTIIIIVFCGY